MFIFETIFFIVISYFLTSAILQSPNSMLPFLQDSNSAYLAYAYILFLIIVVIMYFLYKKFLVLISQKGKKPYFLFRTLMVFILICMTIYMMVILVVWGTFENEYCGENFNKRYRKAVENNDPNTCMDDSMYDSITSSRGFKEGSYCYTPTRKYIQVNYKPDIERLKSSCLSSLARDLDDVSICEMIETHNLPSYSVDYNPIGPGDSKGCVYRYASHTKDIELCRSVEKAEYRCNWQ